MGVASKRVGLATPTTAAGVTSVVEAREPRRVPVVAQGVGQRLLQQPEQWPQLWWRQ